MKDALRRLKREQQLLGTLKRVANLQKPLEVIGRLSETEPVAERGMPGTNRCKREEGKGSKREGKERKGA